MSWMPATTENFTKICRTCLGSDDLGSIFDLSDQNIEVTYLLEYSVCLKATPQDNLPKNICRNCLDRLYKIYEFKQQCHVNEAILKGDVDETVAEDVKHENIENIIKEEYDAQDYSDQILDSEEPNHHDTTENRNEKDEKVEDDGDKYNIHQILFKTSASTEGYEEKEEKPEQNVQKSNIEQCFKIPEVPAIQRHICEICRKVFSKHYRLQQHMRTHTKERPYKCNICLQSFSCYSNLKRHEKIHTGARPYVCSVCGKSFIRSTSLQIHTNTHNGDSSKSSFTCETCSRVFKRLGPFNAHLGEHSSDNKTTKKKNQCLTADAVHKHVCHVCTRAYKTKGTLNAHLTIHEEQKFICDRCGKGCVSLAALRSHLRTHTGEKPYTCVVCHKSFSQSSTLNSHILTHSGHRPYRCFICEKRFTQPNHLTYHMRIHNGERCYKCNYCDTTFAVKGSLTVHLRTHTGETPYVCPICEKGFYDSSSMKKHKKKHLPPSTETRADMVN